MQRTTTLAALLFTASLLTPVAAQSGALKKKLSDVDAVQEQFRVVAQEMYKQVLVKFPDAGKKEMCKEFDCTEAELPQRAATVFLRTWQPAFQLSQAEAALLLKGKFDDKGNRRKVAAAGSVLKSVDVPLPQPVSYLMEKVKSREFRTGFELEFAARILSTMGDRWRKIMEKQRK